MCPYKIFLHGYSVVGGFVLFSFVFFFLQLPKSKNRLRTCHLISRKYDGNKNKYSFSMWENTDKS